MGLPGFLVPVEQAASRRARASDPRLAQRPRPAREAEVQPARIVCGSPVLGATCTGLQAPEWLFPCFGNESCGLFFATLKLPACATCRVV